MFLDLRADLIASYYVLSYDAACVHLPLYAVRLYARIVPVAHVFVMHSDYMLSDCRASDYMRSYYSLAADVMLFDYMAAYYMLFDCVDLDYMAAYYMLFDIMLSDYRRPYNACWRGCWGKISATLQSVTGIVRC